MSYGDRDYREDSDKPHPANGPPWEGRGRDREQPWPHQEWDRPLRHSGFGIASFIISIFCGLLLFAMIAIAAVLVASRPQGLDEESPEAILVGMMILGSLLLALPGGVLGIVGLVQSNRSKTFAILGLLFNAFIFFGGFALVCAGMLMGE